MRFLTEDMDSFMKEREAYEVKVNRLSHAGDSSLLPMRAHCFWSGSWFLFSVCNNRFNYLMS